jgi:hypothetical protein
MLLFCSLRRVGVLENTVVQAEVQRTPHMERRVSILALSNFFVKLAPEFTKSVARPEAPLGCVCALILASPLTFSIASNVAYPTVEHDLT